jgi:hypothetical protein
MYLVRAMYYMKITLLILKNSTKLSFGGFCLFLTQGLTMYPRLTLNSLLSCLSLPECQDYVHALTLPPHLPRTRLLLISIIIHCSPKVETTEMSSNWWISKMWHTHIYEEILLSNIRMKYPYMLQHAWNLKICYVKEFRNKRLHTIWFQLFEMYKISKYILYRKTSGCPGLEWGVTANGYISFGKDKNILKIVVLVA